MDIIPYHKPYKLNVDFSDIFESGMYTNGKYVQELEKRIEDMYKCTCYACSSGTQGLLLVIKEFAWESVSLPAFNWWSDFYILKLLGLEPLWRDIDEKTWLTIDFPTKLRLHTFGNTDIIEANRDSHLYDGTHSLGAKLKAIGQATVISLAPTKMVTAGEGGLILLNEPNEKIKEYRDRCCRMSEFHAKIGLEYLSFLNGFLANKKRIYEYYKKHIPGQFQEIQYSSNYNTVGFLNLEKLKIPEFIETRQYYEPLKRGLKNTDYVYENIVCLPSFYDVDYKLIVDSILEVNKR